MISSSQNPAATFLSRRQVLTGLLAGRLAARRPARAAAQRPNIVVMLVDDLGFSDIGPYGGEIETPHLNRMASQGVRFTQFYNCARCCPTRASLLTGLYPHQAGIGYMEPGNVYNKAINAQRPLPAYQGYLNRNCVTIAEALQPAGYQTLMTGKWHVGAEPGQRPWERGFQRFYGILVGASNHFRPGKLLFSDGQPSEAPPDFYSSDAFSSKAAEFLREADAARPCFLYVAFTAPHWPLHAPAADIAKYRGRYRAGWDALRRSRFAAQKRMGLFPPSLRLSPRHPESYPWEEADQEDMELRMAVYAAMVDRIDQGIGRILAALKDTGREDNTLFLFLSDNGGCAEPYGRDRSPNLPPGPAESNTGYYLPWANASNTPFRLFKHWVHEGGIATPFLARWPGRIPQGVIQTTQTGHVKDLMPTCLDAAGVRYPETYQGHNIQPSEGISLLPSLQDPKSTCHQMLYWEHEGNRAVRDGKWKLVSYYNEIHEVTHRVGTGRRTGAWELYDLEADRTELSDLARVNPEKVKELESRYLAWAKRVGAEDWEALLRPANRHNLE